MKNKLFKTVFSILLLIFLVPNKAYTDVGPKPYVVIEFDGLKDEVYYTTLLSRYESNGPWYLSDEDIPQEHFGYDTPYYKIAWQSFREYKDDDNFYFIEYFDSPSEKINSFETICLQMNLRFYYIFQKETNLLSVIFIKNTHSKAIFKQK